MKRLALLKGNRFNPWHLQPYARLEDWSVTAFRAESEIQKHFRARDDGSLGFDYERVYFDTQAGNPLVRLKHVFEERYRGREPRVLPFHEKLQGFDVVQSWELFTDWSAEAVRAKEAYGTPLAVMVWDNIPFNMERNPERRAMKERVARAADRFIVHTERSRRMLAFEGVDEARIVQMDPGVDTDVFSPGPGARSAWGLPEDAFVILFVGWLLPRKGLDFLLLAMRELLRRPTKTPLHLLVVGSGPGRERIDTLVGRLKLRDACTIVGPVEYGKMPEVFRSADLFVLPSIAMPEWQEQFGMSLIEAMACGVPVISTWSGAIPEIVDDAGVLCQPNDFVSLYEAIVDAMESPSKRKELAEQGRVKALERYTMDRFAGNLRDVYTSLSS